MKAASVNDFGLRRSDFDAEQKRSLRRICGFGCVICGKAVFEYAHIDPPFALARAHEIEKMALLCVEHHTAFDRRGTLSARRIMAARANPRALQAGYAREELMLPDGPFNVRIDGAHFIDCRRILSIDGHDILRVKEPEEPGAPNRLSAVFTDALGSAVAEIDDNGISYRSSAWDVEITGRRVRVRTGPRKVALTFTTHAVHGFVIEQIDMGVGRARLVGSGDSFHVQSGGNGGSMLLGGGSRHGRPGGDTSCISIVEGQSVTLAS